MLTAYQCETIAFVTDGEILCRDCAIARFGEIRIVTSERGLNEYGDLSPLIRYEIDSMSGEEQYERAEERLRDFAEDHPAFTSCLFELTGDTAHTLRFQWAHGAYRLIDKLAEKVPGETCGQCGEEID
jgi:hypothetical protein